jgi:hypothetical protein
LLAAWTRTKLRSLPGKGVGMVPTLLWRVVQPVGILLAATSALLGQGVELTLTEAGSGTPVAGAIVRLLGDKGPVAQGLSNERGRIQLRAPEPGTYRIKADRIGFSGIVVGPIQLAAGQTIRRDIEMPASRLELPTLEVRGKSECERVGQGGPRAAALWEEVNKALTASVLTQRQRPVPLHVRLYQRELNRNRTVRAEWVYASRLTRGQPFQSSPPARLAQVGFVEAGDTTTFHLPDAVLLLSDEFVATHCFRTAPAPAGLAGLAFEPVPGRKVTDVRGTMWVDSTSSELRFLEYTYTGLQGDLGKAGLGGRLEFRRLPGGEWIVGEWHVRMPRTQDDTVRTLERVPMVEPRVMGYVEQGGRVEIATDGMVPVSRAIVRGLVHDSTTGAGLAGAVVAVRGYRDSIFTDAEGRFELVLAAVGEQTVTAAHPKLGFRGARTAVQTVLSLGDTTVVRFAVPALTTITRELCGSVERGRSGIIGVVSLPEGRRVGDLEVRTGYGTSAGGHREERARPSDRGAFALCSLPADQTLSVRLFEGRLQRAERLLRLEWGQFTWVELGSGGTGGPSVPPAEWR